MSGFLAGLMAGLMAGFGWQTVFRFARRPRTRFRSVRASLAAKADLPFRARKGGAPKPAACCCGSSPAAGSFTSWKRGARNSPGSYPATVSPATTSTSRALPWPMWRNWTTSCSRSTNAPKPDREILDLRNPPAAAASGKVTAWVLGRGHRRDLFRHDQTGPFGVDGGTDGAAEGGAVLGSEIVGSWSFDPWLFARQTKRVPCSI